MKALNLLFLCIVCALPIKGAVTFNLESLSKPSAILPQVGGETVFQKILDSKIQTNDYRETDKNQKYNLISHNKLQDSLVNFGQHSFFEGMFKAYSDHRPFVLSPDMIWLLISQGFSQHVNNNAEALRHYFVKHDGKMVLRVISTTVSIDNPDSPWETVFPEFTKQIDAVVGKELVSTLTSDFSTTTAVSRVASQITIMEAMQAYFEYYLVYVSCGIPQITLEGSTEDWQKIIDKANKLRTYELGWWIDPLIPVLEQLKSTAEGKKDIDFWRSMFITPDENNVARCGIPLKIDGWIVKFFPYDKNRQRNNLKELYGSSNLPMELACVDLEYIELNALGKVVKTVPLELWAGFIGLNQNKSDFTLKPEIGWMVRHRDLNDDTSLKAIDKAIQAGSTSFKIGISTLSPAIIGKLLNYQKSSTKTSSLNGSRGLSMTISFFDKIILPKEFLEIKFDQLMLNGVIDEPEIERLIGVLTNVTTLYINGKKYKRNY